MPLRPDLTIIQKFVSQAVIVNTTVLTPVVIGLNRLQVYKKSAGEYRGGVAADPYRFPDFIAGSVIESSSSVLDVPGYETVLRPKIHISTIYGVGEIDDSYVTYNLTASPPTFSVSPSAIVVLTMTSGNSGAYSSSLGQFVDGSGDFITDRVSAGNRIYIANIDGDYIYELDVTDIKDATHLVVTKRNKSASALTPVTDLGAENSYKQRILTNALETFITNDVHADDLVKLTGWAETVNDLGGSYAAEVAGVRVFTDLMGDFATDAQNNDIVYTDALDADVLVPMFYVNSTPVGTTSMNVINADSATPISTAFETNKAYDIRRYTTPKELDNLGTPSIELTDGSFTAVGDAGTSSLTLTGDERIFNSAAANFPGAPVAPVQVGDVIVVDINSVGSAAPGQDAYARFVVTQIDAITNVDLAVVAIDETRVGPTDTGSSLRFRVYTETIVTASKRYGSSYGAELPSGIWAGKRVFTNHNTSVDYAAAGVVIGDYIKDATGAAMFIVRGVGVAAGLNAYQLYVENVVVGAPAPSATKTYFEHSIQAQTSATMKVISVTSETQMLVGNTNAALPAPTVAFQDLVITSIEYKDSAAPVNYRIDFFATGTDLNGTIQASYTAVRTDKVGTPFPVYKSDYKSITGYPTPADPLSLGLSKVFEIYDGLVYAIQVESDLLEKWKEALDSSTTQAIYIPIVCTQDEDVLQAVVEHVKLYSLPDYKRERVSWISHEEVIQELRTNSTTFPGAITFNKSGGTTTIVVSTVDLNEYGTIPSDVISGSWANIGSSGSLSAVSIISVSPSTPSVGQSTIRIVDDNDLPAGTGTLTAWEVKSKPLSLTQRAQKQAAYASSISERRIRNIWPDSVTVPISDEVGLFGGTDIDAIMGAWLLCCTEAGKRAAYRPALPLTNRIGGIYRALNDPFKSNITLQDIVIDGGNYYMLKDEASNFIYSIRAISTDISDVYHLDDNITAQADYYCRLLRTNLTDLMGINILDQSFFDTLMARVQGVNTQIISEKNMEAVEVLGVRKSTVRPDGFELDALITPYFSANDGKITVYI